MRLLLLLARDRQKSSTELGAFLASPHHTFSIMPELIKLLYDSHTKCLPTEELQGKSACLPCYNDLAALPLLLANDSAGKQSEEASILVDLIEISSTKKGAPKVLGPPRSRGEAPRRTPTTPWPPTLRPSRSRGAAPRRACTMSARLRRSSP